ncbi:hypothetical protein, partial [Escherichia coli]|uniref:hypothetical protein n=1 Tax=Escherichia coli TaxID=562 RepID=UPI001BC89FB1
LTSQLIEGYFAETPGENNKHYPLTRSRRLGHLDFSYECFCCSGSNFITIKAERKITGNESRL